MKPNNHIVTSPFSTIWHRTNIATAPRNPYKKKLVAMYDMEDTVTSKTMEHFLSALREVLRSSFSPRHETPRLHAIDKLVEYAKWEDVEWTFWLHEQREWATDKELSRINYHRRKREQILWESEQQALLKTHLEKLEAIP